MEMKSPDFKAVFKRIKKHLVLMGQQTVYAILLMFYAYREKETPAWAKRIIVGTIGYVLTPFDAVPDLSPIVGYTDDLGVLSFGLVAIASHINDSVRINARRQMGSMFGTIDLDQLRTVDEKL